MKINNRIYLIIGAFIIISTNVYSQRSKANKQKYDKLYIGLNYGLYDSKLILDSDISLNIIESKENSYRNGEGWLFQLIVGKSINKNVSLVSGIAVNNFEITQTKCFNFWRCDPTFYGATETIGAERILKMTTIEIPMNVRYKLKYNRFSFYPSSGIRTILYANKLQNVDIFLDNGAVGKHSLNDKDITHNQKINFALEFIAGLSYQFVERFNMTLEPFYRINIKQDEILEDFGATNFRSIGVLVGFEYTIFTEGK